MPDCNGCHDVLFRIHRDDGFQSGGFSFTAIDPQKMRVSAGAGCFPCGVVNDSIKGLMSRNKIDSIKHILVKTKYDNSTARSTVIEVRFKNKEKEFLELFVNKGAHFFQVSH